MLLVPTIVKADMSGPELDYKVRVINPEWIVYEDSKNEVTIPVDTVGIAYDEYNEKISIDFDINNYNTVQEFTDDIVWDNNNYRPSFALQYKKPVEYRTQLGFK